MGRSTISRAKRDQTWREDIITNGLGRVEGIAVDWIAGRRISALVIELPAATTVICWNINIYLFYIFSQAIYTGQTMASI